MDLANEHEFDQGSDQPSTAVEPQGMNGHEIEGAADYDAEGVTVRLEEQGAGNIRADSVTISQGGAGNIEAGNVSITQGGAGRVTADHLTVNQGGVGLARTERLTIEEGGSAFVVMADTADIGAGANVFMLVARNAGGEVRPVLDWRAAAAFGAGLALALTLLRRIRG